MRLLPLLLLALLPAARAQMAAPWQQEVAYEMDVRLLPEHHRLEGRQRLAYVNNSPDTLRSVYYHLYFNAFQPGSMMAERNRHLPDPDPRVVPRIFELGPEEVGHQEVLSLTQDGAPVRTRVVDTILEVELAQPIVPGAVSVFEMDFRAQVPLQTRRSGRDNAEGVAYSMTQWYPKMAHYDATGWHADPYVGREFYAPFGTFDVRITLPAAFVVGATGLLQNPEAVGHGYDRPEGPAVASTPATTAEELTWHFRAERVHDFAWAADPDFLHRKLLVEDVPGREEPVAVHLLYKPEVAEAWAPMGGWMAGMLRLFSEQVGPYPYPQFTVAQGGDGGMEYPMMTLITGRRPPASLFGVTAHEFAHMWFYAVVASNESDVAWMDEGLTEYLATEAFHHVFEGAPGKADHRAAVATVAQAQRLGLWERPNKPSDWFETNTGYGLAAYTGGEALIELLGYVMGDETRDAFLRRYFEAFRFRHPYPADLMQAAQLTSGLQLDWLFDQFLSGEARYDYAAERLEVEPTPEGYRSRITLRRREAGVLPVDLFVRFEDGSAQMVTIPPDVMRGHKPLEPGWRAAAPWRWTFPTYTLTLEGESPVVEALLDPMRRTPDLDRSNDRLRRGGPDVPVEFAGFLEAPQPAADASRFGLSPILVFAHGVGAGAQVRATSPYGRTELQLGLTAWPRALADEEAGLAPVIPDPETSPLDGLDYTAVLTRWLGRSTAVRLAARKHLGILENTARFSTRLGGDFLRPSPHRVSVILAHQHRATDRAFAFFGTEAFRAAPVHAEPFLREASAEEVTLFGEGHLVSARIDYVLGDADGGLAATVEAGSTLGAQEGPGARYDAARAFVSGSTSARLGPFVGRARLLAGMGSDGLAPQKRFRLGAVPAEARWRSDAYRALAAPFKAPREEAHLVALSGFGPVGYLLPGTVPSHGMGLVERPEPLGTGVVAGTLALELGPPRPAGASPESQALLDPLRFELFAGFGMLRGEDDWSPLLADAGLGVAYDVSALAPVEWLVAQSDVLQGLRLRAKFPLWLSHPEEIGEEAAFGFRWLVGVQAGL